MRAVIPQLKWAIHVMMLAGEEYSFGLERRAAGAANTDSKHFIAYLKSFRWSGSEEKLERLWKRVQVSGFLLYTGKYVLTQLTDLNMN